MAVSAALSSFCLFIFMLRSSASFYDALRDVSYVRQAISENLSSCTNSSATEELYSCAALLLLSTAPAADRGLLHLQVVFACSPGGAADTALGAIWTELRSDRLHPRSRGFVVLSLATLLSAGLLAATLGGRAATGARCSAGPAGLGAGGRGSSAGAARRAGVRKEVPSVPRVERNEQTKKETAVGETQQAAAHAVRQGLPLPQQGGAQRSPAACRRCPAGRYLHG